MNTLIYTALLGLFCLVAEILNFRKVLMPFVVMGLAIIFGVNLNEWNSPGSFYHDMIMVDHYSVAFSALALFSAMLLFMLGSDYYQNDEKHISDYAAIMLFILCGALIMFNYNHLVMLFLGIETLSISVYVLAGSKRFDTASNEAGFKYFLMGSFMSGFLLFGIALIYGSAGSLYLNKIYEYTSLHTQLPATFKVGVLLILFALFFKIGAVPFHFWSPDVYQGAPAFVTMLMGSLVKVAGLGAFYKLLSTAFVLPFYQFELVFSIVVIATIVVGNTIAMQQNSLKRMLAYSGIAHAGYMMLALISVRSSTQASLYFYLFSYAISTIGIFAALIPVIQAKNEDDTSILNGLVRSHPALAFAISVFLLSMAGIPPFSGFFAKYFVLSEALKSGYFWLVIVAILASVASVYYYLRPIIAMYAKPGSEKEITISFPHWLVIWVCVLLTVFFGIFPDYIASVL